MDLTFFFALLGSLLLLAFVANRLARFTRVPDMTILMASGVLIGPVLHWVNPDLFREAMHGFGSLALMLILFEGGLDLKLREILQHFGAGFFLSVFSYVLSSAAIAAVCMQAGTALFLARRAVSRRCAWLYQQFDFVASLAASELAARSAGHHAGGSFARRCSCSAGGDDAAECTED
jgi:Sodium/hydrogen exchanger family